MKDENLHRLFTRHVHKRMNKDGTPMPFPFIVLGLVGETGETYDEAKSDANRDALINETGDALWYLEAIHNDKWGDLGFDSLDRVADGKGILHHLAKIAEMGKKEAWHGKPAPLSLLAYHLGAVLTDLETIARVFDFTLEDAMRANIEKLEKRYPMGFIEGGGIREGADGFDANGMYVR